MRGRIMQACLTTAQLNVRGECAPTDKQTTCPVILSSDRIVSFVSKATIFRTFLSVCSIRLDFRLNVC